MREVKSHHVPGIPETVRVFPEGDPGPGGAQTSYRLAVGVPGQEFRGATTLKFQTGDPLKDPNGITNEALLTTVADRLEQFQKGPFSCRENAIALTHIETALLWLKKRTEDRVAREVRGEQKA